jgi:hypothetical protein
MLVVKVVLLHLKIEMVSLEVLVVVVVGQAPLLVVPVYLVKVFLEETFLLVLVLVLVVVERAVQEVIHLVLPLELQV